PHRAETRYAHGRSSCLLYAAARAAACRRLLRRDGRVSSVPEAFVRGSWWRDYRRGIAVVDGGRAGVSPVSFYPRTMRGRGRTRLHVISISRWDRPWSNLEHVGACVPGRASFADRRKRVRRPPVLHQRLQFLAYNLSTMNLEQKLQELKKRDRLAEEGGGTLRRERQLKEGKMNARERIEFLLDEGTFEETDKLVTHRSHDFGMEEQKYYGDGFITGYGRIE